MLKKSWTIAAVICVSGLALSGCMAEGGYYDGYNNGYYSPYYNGAVAPNYQYNRNYYRYERNDYRYNRNYHQRRHTPDRPSYAVPATPPVYFPGSPAQPLIPARPDDNGPRIGEGVIAPARPADFPRFHRPTPRIGEGAIVPARPADIFSPPPPPFSRSRPDEIRRSMPTPRIGEGVIAPARPADISTPPVPPVPPASSLRRHPRPGHPTPLIGQGVTVE